MRNIAQTGIPNARESLTDPRVRFGSLQPEQIQFFNYSEIQARKSQPRICGVQVHGSEGQQGKGDTVVLFEHELIRFIITD